MTVLGEGDEVAEIAQVHGWGPCPCNRSYQ
jgi:hypothetical protein